ncbi:unnamed protein product [Pleuronectes platessa]|uniref:Uncharacterized protein n=1 Tax=Pleuronectes platessa TaxID=8262 RepID=A0A9N7Y5K9_PLEPL|nr:unnamed protein product [Pleuronectes platessa]
MGLLYYTCSHSHSSRLSSSTLGNDARTSDLIQMDPVHRRAVLQRELRVLNQKAHRDLQQKLSTLDKQHRYTCRMLQQRRDSLIKEQRRVVMVKVCEPKATGSIAMKDIGEHRDTETRVRGVHTSDGRRLCSSKSKHHCDASEEVKQSRSISAPPSTEPMSPVRHRGYVQSNVSLMQMKNIATIDSISEKELARQQRKAREELERVRRLQRETLHKRVAAFIESMKDRSSVDILEPP